MLRAELHAHTGEDPIDKFISYSAEELIDYLAARGYDVLAITLHHAYFYPERVVRYARKKGMLLVPGVEARIQGKDVLLYNFSRREFDKISDFEDIRAVKKKKHLVAAPHPFFPADFSLMEYARKYIDIFDAIEYCHFYRPMLNYNKPAVRLAREYGKPMIGTGDGHVLYQFGHTFTGIDAPKTVEGVVDAVKRGKVQVSTRPFPRHLMARVLLGIYTRRMGRIIRRIR